MIVSPCISICKTDPLTGFCYGCGRSIEDKKMWKNEETSDEWKKENLIKDKDIATKTDLKKEKLKIEKGISKPDKVWEYFRVWAYVVVEKPKHPWYPAHILITSKGERVPIGDFLTEKEKLTLVENLKNIINSFK